MDSEQGGVLRNIALFESSKIALPPVSPRQPKQVVDEDAFYDSVPQEENISYIDGLLIKLHAITVIRFSY